MSELLVALALVATGAGLVLVLYLADRLIERIVRIFVPAREDPGQRGTHQLPPDPYF